MLVSIVTPCYNSAEYLEQCILSIKGQRRNNFEHIIVDGNSTDGTLDIIRKHEGTYPMRWISEKDGGMYEAIAKGFRMAKGDIFAWLNSDDMYMPWTTYTMERVCNSGVIDWCTGLPAYYNDEGMHRMAPNPCHWSRNYVRALIARGWYDGRRRIYIQQESTFWTRRLYEKVGGINPQYKYAGDYDLWRRMAQYAELYTVNALLGGFRVHKGQKSSDIEKYNAELPKLGLSHRLMTISKMYSLVQLMMSSNKQIIQLNRLPNI